METLCKLERLGGANGMARDKLYEYTVTQPAVE